MTRQQLLAKKVEVVRWLKTPMDADCDAETRYRRRLKRWGWRFVIAALVLASDLSDPLPSRFNWFFVTLGVSLALVCGFMVVATVILPAADVSGRKPPANLSNCPPRCARFLLLLVPKRNREYLLGDLEEEYLTIVLPEYGDRLARLWYWWQVAISIAPLLWTQIKRTAGFVLLWKRVR